MRTQTVCEGHQLKSTELAHYQRCLFGVTEEQRVDERPVFFCQLLKLIARMCPIEKPGMLSDRFTIFN